MIKYIGYCQDIRQQYVYKVEFIKPSSSSSTTNIELSGDSPIILKTNSDELFAPIKTQSVTVNIVSKNYIFDLYNVDFSVECNISKRLSTETDNDFKYIFQGYVTPNVYTQDFNYISTISVECISYLAKLKYLDYQLIDTEPGIYSMTKILMHLLNNEPIMYCARRRIGIDETIYDAGLNHIFLDERNFFENNEEHKPWKQYEVLEEICKILGVSLVEHQGEIEVDNTVYYKAYYMIQYRSGIITRYINTAYLTAPEDIPDYTPDVDDPVPSTVIQTTIILYDGVNNIDLFASSNNTISLEETFKKIEVKANTYPYEDAVNELLSSDNWELYSHIYNNVELSTLMNTAFCPYFQFKRSDDKIFNIYYMYYTTDTMTPYQYQMLLDGNNHYSGFQKYPLIDNKKWMCSMITDFANPSQLVTDSNYIGVGLLKVASYEISKANLTSSLNWEDEITLYLGLKNLNIENYYNHTHQEDWMNWMDAWDGLNSDVDSFIRLNFGYNESGINRTYLPDNPLLKIESESDVIIKQDSYLVISGKMGLNDCEYIDSQPNDWVESDNFNNPMAFCLVDQNMENVFKHHDNLQALYNNRNYVGFPFLDVQIRIGDKICCEAQYLDVSDGGLKKQYKWMTAAELDDLIDSPDYDPNMNYSCHFTIPVAQDKFSFFKLHDITNTCDWRLGLESANGFAIPLPKDANLSGKLIIYINYPTQELFTNGSISRYYDNYSDFLKLPWIERRIVTIEPNPNNMWNVSNWNPEDIQYTYKGTYPNNVIIKNLKFDIKPVKFFTVTDTADKNSNNKQTDHTYSNIINEYIAIDDDKSIECKINTQDDAKDRSFSSLLKKDSDGKYQYVDKMWTGTTGLYQIQENNVIDTYKAHYEDRKIIFDCDIKGVDYGPLDVFAESFSNNIHQMIPDSQEKDLRNNSTKIKLIEI